MNEQLQSKLIEILSAIQAGTRAAGDFALEQLPDIAQQYVMYGRAVNTMWVALGILLMVVMPIAGKKALAAANRVSNAPYGEEGPAMAELVATSLICLIAGVAGFAMTMDHLAQAVLVWAAPKVWLIKELASLIK